MLIGMHINADSAQDKHLRVHSWIDRKSGFGGKGYVFCSITPTQQIVSLYRDTEVIINHLKIGWCCRKVSVKPDT